MLPTAKQPGRAVVPCLRESRLSAAMEPEGGHGLASWFLIPRLERVSFLGLPRCPPSPGGAAKHRRSWISRPPLGHPETAESLKEGTGSGMCRIPCRLGSLWALLETNEFYKGGLIPLKMLGILQSPLSSAPTPSASVRAEH